MKLVNQKVPGMAV